MHFDFFPETFEIRIDTLSLINAANSLLNLDIPT